MIVGWIFAIIFGLQTIITSEISTKVALLPLAAEARQSLIVPVMFVFGERDNLVGDADKARMLV
jgi:hypothetical protein